MIQEIDPVLDWAVKLVVAVKRHCEEKGYENYTVLRKKLDIPRSKWEHMMGGRITSNDIYASLFVEGIGEADPRTLPSRRYVVPKTGVKGEIKRAWTDEQFEQWMENPIISSGRSSSPKSPAKGQQRSRAPSRRNAASGGETAVLSNPVKTQEQLEEIAPQVLALLRSGVLRDLVKEEVAEQLKYTLPANPLPNRVSEMEPSDRETQDILAKLLRKLTELSKPGSSKEARTKFANRHGQLLADLFPYIEGFMKTDEGSRETYLAGIQHLDLGRG